MNAQLDIPGRFTFDLQGFQATYTYKGEITTLTLCPAAFCELLKETGLIEDFTLDRNSEPVILYTDNKFPPGYGFEYWCAFVKFFPISYKMAVKLLEYREERREHREFQARIVELLQPLQAAQSTLRTSLFIHHKIRFIMATKTTSTGNALKETITNQDTNEEQTMEPTQEEIQPTLRSIHAFLDDNDVWNAGPAWCLHVFCRTGNGEDYGYDSSELEYAANFCGELLKTFLHPKASKLFCQINNQTPEHLIEYLERLRDLFTSMRDDEVVRAKMDEIDVEQYGYKYEIKELHRLKVYYQRESDLSETRARVFEKYKGQFKY